MCSVHRVGHESTHTLLFFKMAQLSFGATTHLHHVEQQTSQWPQQLMPHISAVSTIMDSHSRAVQMLKGVQSVSVCYACQWQDIIIIIIYITFFQSLHSLIILELLTA